MSGETTPSPAAAPRRLSGAGRWIAGAAVLIALPFVFRSGTALTMMSLMGIMIVFSLSYNILLGQTGLLSFGHAVYYGLGAFAAVHAMNAVVRAGLPVPLPVVPLFGGLAGLGAAVVFGWVSTKRSGTAFAMISLGLAELVASSSLILRSFFGGEEGVTANRTKLFRVLDVSFGPQLQVYFLIAAWCFVCVAAMYALTRTPLGRMCNAARDNPDRLPFVGYDPQVVRYIAFCLAGAFAGVAGGLAAVNFEIANAAYLGVAQSGVVILTTFIGGAGFFVGPIVGAVLVTWLQIMLSDLTEVWQLYFGVMFIATVMFAPGGLVGIVMLHRPLWRARRLGGLVPSYLLALVTGTAMCAGVVLATELVVRLTVKAAEGPMFHLAGVALNAKGAPAWSVAAALAIGGFLAFRTSWFRVRAAFDRALAAARGRGAAA